MKYLGGLFSDNVAIAISTCKALKEIPIYKLIFFFCKSFILLHIIYVIKDNTFFI